MAEIIDKSFYENCPVGIRNEASVTFLGERMEILLNNMNENISEIKADVKDLSTKLDNVSDNLDSRIDSVEKSIPSIVDKQIEARQGKASKSAWKWVICSLGGAIILSVVPALIKKWLGL